MRPFTKRYTALSELNPQNTAFGRKRLSGHILLPRYQKTGVHAAGFWWIILFEDVPKLYPFIRWFRWIIKLWGCFQAYIIHFAFFGVLRTFYRHRRFASCLFSMKRVSPAKASLRLQAAISLAFAPKVSKGRRTCRLFAFGVATRLFSASRNQPAKHSLRLQATIRPCFAIKVSKGRRTCRRLLMDYTFQN